MTSAPSECQGSTTSDCDSSGEHLRTYSTRGGKLADPFANNRNGDILALAGSYVSPIKFVVPSFLLIQTLAAFLRNDKTPALATIAVLSGGHIQHIR